MVLKYRGDFTFMNPWAMANIHNILVNCIPEFNAPTESIPILAMRNMH
jgi:hypothetical protein